MNRTFYVEICRLLCDVHSEKTRILVKMYTSNGHAEHLEKVKIQSKPEDSGENSLLTERCRALPGRILKTGGISEMQPVQPVFCRLTGTEGIWYNATSAICRAHQKAGRGLAVSEAPAGLPVWASAAAILPICTERLEFV